MSKFRVTIEQISSKFFTMDFEAKDEDDARKQAWRAEEAGLNDWQLVGSEIFDQHIDDVEKLTC